MEDNAPFSSLNIGQGFASDSCLMALLQCDGIVPGSDASYQHCKDLYSYHPLGAKLAELPIKLAQSQPRDIEISGGPTDLLMEAYLREWRILGGVGADRVISNVWTLARVYGISSPLLLAEGLEPNDPLPLDNLYKYEVKFNVLDPLNTAGSLVLDQDPNSLNFQRPTAVSAAGQFYHPSRTCVVMNEQPLYIQWSNSAFGFVGRSVYQRTLFPLKSFIQTMITDDVVSAKAAMLVYKAKSPGAIVDKRMLGWMNLKRWFIKAAQSGNVVSIGTDEELASLDLMNLEPAAKFARDNIIKNIAAGAGMPALMMNEETLAKGFGEGSEDAKVIARYIQGIREEMDALYRWFDVIVMYRAWNPDFYAGLQNLFSEYKSKPYETAFSEWKKGFKATWPNLLTEPNSEKADAFERVMKQWVAMTEVITPFADQDTKTRLAQYGQDLMNAQDIIPVPPLDIDFDSLASYEPPQPMMGEEPSVAPESGRS